MQNKYSVYLVPTSSPGELDSKLETAPSEVDPGEELVDLFAGFKRCPAPCWSFNLIDIDGSSQ